VIDTGIDATHADLLDNLKGGYNAINPAVSWADDNGHGTHVAGTIAAIDNSIGVIGVAREADLYAVKVLNRKGSGYTSDIIEGIDWAIENDMDIINMSLGSSWYSATFEAACTRAIDAGIVVVAAAGNSGPGAETVGYPAKYPGVIGVSATDSSNVIAYFSSRGEGVDIAAPGVSIYSTYKGGAYTTMSGTSMASPHVAGVVALILTQPDGNDGMWTPAEVEARLEGTAQDLGTDGPDLLYGAGLVRADLAVAAPN
jgi:subtilisin family serine protease